RDDFKDTSGAVANRQTRDRLNAQFAKVQAMLDAKRPTREIDPIFEAVRRDLARWREAAPTGESPRERMERAERWGMTAASEKRIAELHMLSGDRGQAVAAWRQSRDWYQKAAEVGPGNHSVLTQFPSR